MRSGSVRVGLAALAACGLVGCSEIYGEVSAAAPPGSLEELMRQAQQQDAPVPPADPAAQAKFLADNARTAGVQTTASGLQYKVLTSGPATGVRPVLGDAVKVNYKGSLSDGTPFDASQPGQPSEWQVGQLVEGFNEALTLMRKGDKWMIYIPASLGYGDQQRGSIPAGSVLVFEVELVDVTPTSAPTADG